MLKQRPFSLAALTPFVALLKARFKGGKPPVQLALPAPESASTSVTSAQTPAQPAPVRQPHPEDFLSIPILNQSPDDLACHTAQQRGLFLARQDRWGDLASEIRDADKDRKTTPAGMPVADLLAYGARSDVVHAVEHALQDGRKTSEGPLIDGILALESLLRDHKGDPIITLIVALTHIDAGWAWRGTGWETVVPKLNRERCAAHFDRARHLMSPLCGLELDSPLMAAARCALLAGLRDPKSRIADDYEDLIDLDPTNHRHMRALGNHLLPRWFGDYQQLELEARRTASRTQDIWGAGGYTWVCFDAIAADDRACALVDVDFFIDGLMDIIEARPDQAMINLLAAYCSVALLQGAGLNSEADLPRMQIADCANWLIHDHLRELHPMIWAHAAEGFDNNSRVTSLSRFAARGRANALEIIADQFRDDIKRGHRVTFTQNGPKLHPV